MRALTKEEYPYFPKKIHFLWIDGRIPEAYLQNIERLSKVKNDFEVTLWVENPELYKNIPADYRIRKITDLKADMNDLIWYKIDDRYNKFWNSIYTKEGEFNNSLRVFELLKYEILQQEGGYYFDVKTPFLINSETKLMTERSPYLGFKLNLHVDNDFQVFFCTADILAALPDNSLIISLLKKLINGTTDTRHELLLHVIEEDQKNYNLSFEDLKACATVLKYRPKSKSNLKIQFAGINIGSGAELNTRTENISKNASYISQSIDHSLFAPKDSLGSLLDTWTDSQDITDYLNANKYDPVLISDILNILLPSALMSKFFPKLENLYFFLISIFYAEIDLTMKMALKNKCFQLLNLNKDYLMPKINEPYVEEMHEMFQEEVEGEMAKMINKF